MEFEFSVDTILELISVLLAILYVILAAKEHISCWIFGIVSSVIGVYLTYKSGLPGQALLYAYYVLIAFYGWYSWGKKNDDSEGLMVRWWKWKQHAIALSIGVVATLGVYYGAQFLLEEDLLLLDTATAAFSVIATFMLTRKVLDNWIYWIVIDSASLILYFTQGLNFFTVLFGIYLVLSIYGLVNWKKQQQRHVA